MSGLIESPNIDLRNTNARTDGPKLPDQMAICFASLLACLVLGTVAILRRALEAQASSLHSTGERSFSMVA